MDAKQEPTSNERILRKDRAFQSLDKPIHRMGFAGQLYHQIHGQQPISIDLRYSRQIESDEQPYQRPSAKVGEQWIPLDCGWLEADNVGMVIIQNLEARFTQAIPSPQERAEAEAKIIVLGVVLDGTPVTILPVARVVPGITFVLDPVLSLTKYRVCCLSGSARYNLTLLPK